MGVKVGDAIHKKRQPIPTSHMVSANVRSTAVETAPLYACVSGRARATVDDAVKIDALLDGGSEICLMPHRIFEKLELPIDTDINWQINACDQSENA